MREAGLRAGRTGLIVHRVLPSVAIALLVSSLAMGHGFRNPPAGAVGVAMDGGKIANIDDASAATINPANLVDVKRGVLISATYADSETDLSTPVGSLSTRGGDGILPSIFGVLPLGDGSFVAGLGLTSPYGQSTEWPAGLGVVNYYAEMRTLGIFPSVATRLSDAISVAVGVDVYSSDLELKSTVSGADGTVVSLNGDGVGIGVNAAVTWRLTERQRLACTYRSPYSVEYEGDTEFSSALLASSDFEAEIDFPSTVTLGYGIRLTDAVALGADVEWVEFSRNESLMMDYGLYNLADDFQDLRAIPQDWDDVWTLGVAGSWDVAEAWTLRGGYKYMESPIPDSTLAATLPDADKHGLSLGVGWQGEKDAVDIGYMYLILDDRDVVTAGIPLSYESQSYLVALNYSRQF
jgi:long-chain fatty acid transport protein